MVRQRELYSSAVRSQHMIREALLSIMQEKHFNDISISEIMKRADLVRRTFYAHFKTKEEVLTSYIDELVSASFVEILNGVQECNGSVALIYFRLWCEHKAFVLLLKKNNQMALLKSFDAHISSVNQQFNAFSNIGFSKTAEKIAPKFYAGAMWNLLDIWIEEGMNETPEELTDLFAEMFMVGKDSGSDTSCSFKLD